MTSFQTRLSCRVTTIGSSALESQSVAARHAARPCRPTTATRSPMESAPAERPDVVVSARSVVDGSRRRFGVGFEAAGYRLHLLYSGRRRNDPESDGDHVDSSVEATSNQWGGSPACRYVAPEDDLKLQPINLILAALLVEGGEAIRGDLSGGCLHSGVLSDCGRLFALCLCLCLCL